jgi:hypothetical protein
MFSPKPKPGKTVAQITAQAVETAYNNGGIE